MLARCKWVKTDTPQDPSLNNEMLATDNSVAQLQGDRDKTGGRASASHGNDRNGHSVQGSRPRSLRFLLLNWKAAIDSAMT